MIGGNCDLELQVLTTVSNELGGTTKSWNTSQIIRGFLDLSGGDSKYTTFDAKIQESSHIFIAEYVEIDPLIETEKSRALVDSKIYDVMLIDDPMGLHKHLEIFLKYTGGQ